MKRLIVALSLLFGAVSAEAAVNSYQPNPADLGDLDHHSVYTWDITGISLNNVVITSATLTISNIANWDTSQNILYIYLLDSARNAGVASFIDDPTDSSPITDFTDDFANPRYHGDPNWLVAPGTRQTKLGSPSFTTTPHTYTISFTQDELATLTSYINNGDDIAFGLDPDCHFFNDGITFSCTTVPVPEFSTGFPVAGLVGVAVALESLRRRRKHFSGIR